MANEQENLARRYLLGQLPEAEQAALEAQFVADTARLDEVWAAEHQLIDDYVRQRLARAERGQFERHYLAAPRHRERVAVARLLLDQADAAEREPSFWAQVWAALRAPQWAWGVALASLLLLAGGAWLRAERARVRERRFADQNVQHQQRERELTAQLAEARAENERLAAALAEPKPPEQSPARPATLAFLLTATLLRGGGAPQPLTIPRGVQQIALQMRLETREHVSYRADLRTVEGAPVWHRQNLKATGSRVTATVPAAKLPAGDYLLTLSGVAATGAAEEINQYFFRVK